MPGNRFWGVGVPRAAGLSIGIPLRVQVCRGILFCFILFFVWGGGGGGGGNPQEALLRLANGPVVGGERLPGLISLGAAGRQLRMLFLGGGL